MLEWIDSIYGLSERLFTGVKGFRATLRVLFNQQ